MKLWIIYKNGIGFSRIIAEILQDRLEDYIDVDVGSVEKIDPNLLVEEKLDFLIFGDIVNRKIPSREIQDWLLKYREISRKKNVILKMVSGFYVVSTGINAEPSWAEFLHNNVKAEIIYPPILWLKLNREELVLENGALELVKEYSNDFIELLTNKRKRSLFNL